MRAFWIGVVVLAVITAGVFLIPTGERPRGALVADTTTTTPTNPATRETATVQATNGAESDKQDKRDAPVSRVEPVAGETNPGGPMMPAEMPAARPPIVPVQPVPAEPAIKKPDAAPRPGTDMPYPDEGAGHAGGPGVPVTGETPIPAEKPDTTEVAEAENKPEPAETPAPVPDAEPVSSETKPSPAAAPEKADEKVEKKAAAEVESKAESKAERARRLFSHGKKKPRAPAEPVVETPSGLLLDGRWKVEGKGTAAEPYRIGWDLLTAVKRVYQPRRGKDKIPEWIMALNGKRVTIEGYTLLPVGATSLKEMLVMLNQWDGCCIGVPPTPFDAIEVNLRDKLTSDPGKVFGQGGAVSYGRITGRFEVDPYLSQGWLLGLYLINDAEADLYGPAGSP